MNKKVNIEHQKMEQKQQMCHLLARSSRFDSCVRKSRPFGVKFACSPHVWVSLDCGKKNIELYCMSLFLYQRQNGDPFGSLVPSPSVLPKD